MDKILNILFGAFFICLFIFFEPIVRIIHSTFKPPQIYPTPTYINIINFSIIIIYSLLNAKSRRSPHGWSDYGFGSIFFTIIICIIYGLFAMYFDLTYFTLFMFALFLYNYINTQKHKI